MVNNVNNDANHRWWALRLPGQVIIGVLVLVVGAGSTVTYVRQAAELERVVRCNSDFKDALLAQSVAAERESSAQRQLVTVLLAGDVARASDESKRALRAYLAALDQLERTRAANPLPRCRSLGWGR